MLPRKSDGLVRVLIVYLGPFPSYWPLTVRSMGENRSVSWVIVTDQNLSDIPDNVEVIRRDLPELRACFSERLGYDAALYQPYKLVDFKPAYGFLFEDILRGFDYWGYCDIDVVFGCLDQALRVAATGLFDIVGGRGHFSLLRNEPNIRSLYARHTPGVRDARSALGDPRIHLYDEYGGFYDHIKYSALLQWNNIDIFDIDVARYQMRATSSLANTEFAYVWQDGQVREILRESVQPVRTACYIHLQKRKLIYDAGDQPADHPLVVFSPLRVTPAASLADAVAEVGKGESDRLARLRWGLQRLRRHL